MSKTIHCTNPNCGALIEIPDNATQIICPDCNLWHFPNAYDDGSAPDSGNGDYGIPAVSEYQAPSSSDNYDAPDDPYKTPTSNQEYPASAANQQYQTPNLDQPAQQPVSNTPPPAAPPPEQMPPPQAPPSNPYANPSVSDYPAPSMDPNPEPVDPYQPPHQNPYTNNPHDQYQPPVEQNYHDDMGQKPPLVTEYQEAGRDDDTLRNQGLAQPDEPEISFGFLVTETGERLKLNEGENIIGRKNTDLIIDDKTVSRKHCVVEVIVSSSGQVEHMIYDIGHSEGASSTNGVFISGRSLRLQDYERIQIRNGSSIQIGSVRLHLQT